MRSRDDEPKTEDAPAITPAHDAPKPKTLEERVEALEQQMERVKALTG